MNYEDRIRRVSTGLESAQVDALLVTSGSNVRYLTGFSGTNGQVLVLPGRATFFSDPRYRARAAQIVEGADVVIYPNRLTDVLAEHAASLERLGFESVSVSVAEHAELIAACPGAELVATKGLVEDLRRAKDPDELGAIREAVRLADAAFSDVVDRLRPGRTEREIAWDIETTLRELGAEAGSFEQIVGSGRLSSHIHHTPTTRELALGDVVLLDFGARVEGYCSDLTRTVGVGGVDGAVRETYLLVLQAQEAGIGAIAGGARGDAVDARARQVVAEAGHEERFGHGLGHGVGLEIHEAPRLHPSSDDVLRAGDVVTVEPGVYVSDGFGIRIEDCVLVTADGAEVLSSAPKNQLLEL